jgi:putative effector of murein hydrolase
MIASTPDDIWVYLAQTPLLWLTVTLIAYGMGYIAFTRSGSNPIVNPVAIAAALLIALLLITDTPYQTYFEGAHHLGQGNAHWTDILTPATEG